jgi:hypothetical protein
VVNSYMKFNLDTRFPNYEYMLKEGLDF